MGERNEYNRIDRKPVNFQKSNVSMPIWVKITIALLVIMFLASFVALIQQSVNVSDLRVTVTSLEIQNDNVQAQYSSQQVENQNLQILIETLEAENQELESRLVNLESEMDKLTVTPVP